MNRDRVNWIRDNVFIVPFNEAMTVRARLEATGVLNVARECDWASIPTGVEYAKVPLDNDYNDVKELLGAAAVLSGLCIRHDKVIVHCRHAVNRSPVVVAVMLLTDRENRFSWHDAVEIVETMRSPLDIHRGILRTLSVLSSGPTEQEISEAVH